MQLKRTSDGSFALRVFLPIGAFLLLLSLAANAFFISTQHGGVLTAVPTSSSSSAAFDPVVLQPVAFGLVSRPIAMHPRLLDGSGAPMSGIASYALPPGTSPLPENFPLLRDQGIPFDLSAFAPFFRAVGIPVDPLKFQLLPETYTFKSADGSLRVSFSASSRTLIVTRLQLPQPMTSVSKADNAEALALASTFVQSFGITPSLYGAGKVIDVPGVGDQPGKTVVTWALNIASVPVVGLDGLPVPAISVQVGRVSHRAIGMTMTLLSPYQLVSSMYPTASFASMSHLIGSGGLLAAPYDPNGLAITYSNVGLVYLLLPQDGNYSTYLVPVVRAFYSVQKDCGDKCQTYPTLMPALDPKNFEWQVKPAPTFVPAPPASAAASMSSSAVSSTAPKKKS